MPPSNSWNSARIQNALSDATRLREAGNVAFRAGNYKLSTEKYGEASYDTLYLKGLRHLQAIPSTGLDLCAEDHGDAISRAHQRSRELAQI